MWVKKGRGERAERKINTFIKEKKLWEIMLPAFCEKKKKRRLGLRGLRSGGERSKDFQPWTLGLFRICRTLQQRQSFCVLNEKKKFRLTGEETVRREGDEQRKNTCPPQKKKKRGGEQNPKIAGRIRHEMYCALLCGNRDLEGKVD